MLENSGSNKLPSLLSSSQQLSEKSAGHAKSEADKCPSASTQSDVSSADLFASLQRWLDEQMLESRTAFRDEVRRELKEQIGPVDAKLVAMGQRIDEMRVHKRGTARQTPFMYPVSSLPSVAPVQSDATVPIIETQADFGGDDEMTRGVQAVQSVDLWAASMQSNQRCESLKRGACSEVAHRCRLSLAAGFRMPAWLEKVFACIPEQGCLHKHERMLSAASIMLVISNALYIGVEQNMTMEALLRNENPPEWRGHVELVFTLLLVLDLVLRFFVMGRRFFLDRSERLWNVF
jgi:hypothetical protein